MPVAALFGHALGAINSRYIEAVETMPVLVACKFAGHIRGLLDGVQLSGTTYAQGGMREHQQRSGCSWSARIKVFSPSGDFLRNLRCFVQ